MTNTHLRHFGLDHLVTSDTNIVLEGSLADCKRLAFAHGLEVVKEEGPILSCTGGKAIYGTSPTVRYYLTRGLIHIAPNSKWILVMNLQDWNQAI